MMELIIVVCLQAAPDRCEERSIGLYPEMTALTCVMQGQPHIVAWVAAHPELRVTAGPAAITRGGSPARDAGGRLDFSAARMKAPAPVQN